VAFIKKNEEEKKTSQKIDEKLIESEVKLSEKEKLI